MNKSISDIYLDKQEFEKELSEIPVYGDKKDEIRIYQLKALIDYINSLIG